MTPPLKSENQIQNRLELTADHIRALPTMLLSPVRIPPVLVMLKEHNSPAAEQYRLLAHTVEKLIAEKPGITIGVSSAVEGEGKTVTSLNLALALAETKVRQVALIDADFRGGQVAQTLGLGEVPGLTEALQGSLQISRIVRRVEKNLVILPGGARTSQPLGLLRSAAWHELVGSLRAHFDCIVVDCPPICISEEMPVLDDIIDKLILVVRSGVTRQETLRDALDLVPPGKMAGLVLNAVPLSARRYRPYKRE
ncbi:MAG: CpsD/CapB family tyrosine-protein kinase [Pseudomonadota bacterium]